MDKLNAIGDFHPDFRLALLPADTVSEWMPLVRAQSSESSI